MEIRWRCWLDDIDLLSWNNYKPPDDLNWQGYLRSQHFRPKSSTDRTTQWNTNGGQASALNSAIDPARRGKSFHREQPARSKSASYETAGACPSSLCIFEVMKQYMYPLNGCVSTSAALSEMRLARPDLANKISGALSCRRERDLDLGATACMRACLPRYYSIKSTPHSTLVLRAHYIVLDQQCAFYR